MKNLPEARVARLAECHKEQKAGYDQHASFSMKPACSDIITNTDLAEFMIHCEKQAFADATIQTKYKILRHMIRENVNLADPETVKLYIKRNIKWSNGHKNLAVFTYNEYAKMKGIQWTPPLYPKNETLPFVPTEKEIDALISGTSKKVSIALQALKETGFRIGELWQCKWTDIDEEKSTLKCNNPEKGCKPREVRISSKLLARLNTLPKQNNYIFSNTRLGFTRTMFNYQKKRLVEKLNNPRLKQIHFHTLRHYHATRLYNETKSLIEVQARLGHRNINSTMVYTHIVEFDEESQNYHHAIAKDEKEAFKEEIVGYGIPKELSEELFSHTRDTINFQADLKGKVYFFGDIAVLTFGAFETETVRLVNSRAISIVAEKMEQARFVKEYIRNAQGKIHK